MRYVFKFLSVKTNKQAFSKLQHFKYNTQAGNIIELVTSISLRLFHLASLLDCFHFANNIFCTFLVVGSHFCTFSLVIFCISKILAQKLNVFLIGKAQKSIKVYCWYLLVFLSFLIAIFTLKILFAIAFFLTCAITFLFIYFSETQKPDAYFSFGVETCSGLPLLFLILMKYF